ncbi:sugar kinase [Leifsonia shinshuensis]|uniref:sugar kinase n=1 Tax=Leifsonia shinshuensis TaxID=150026 RepID=UPI001F50A36F|nr:sugar kinase [Leifsonia shinshuensis]MCI0156743.1 sugar kinase [Leifsonia shinshuensis]
MAVPATLVTIGEAMIALYPDHHLPLSDARSFGSDVGGAEFNVATSLARLGLPTAWVSRLGADGFGDRILGSAREAGVDTSAVERDPARPTGLYVKEPVAGPAGVRTRMHYYRSRSAASVLGVAQLRSEPAAALLRGAALVHTSGITPALSASAAEAAANLRSLIGPDTLVSVDLNLRPALWIDGDRSALQALVGQADLLFAGHEETEAQFGHSDPARLFADLPHLETLVLKDEERRASAYRRDGGDTHVPSLTVEVVEPVGAGDAFAAGFLAGRAEGRDDSTALRFGHALAALTLIGHGDRPLTVPTEGERDAIAAVDDASWARWRVHPGDIPWHETTS